MAGRPATHEVSVERVLPLDAGDAWDLLVDARHHARWIPLTRVDAPPPALGVQVVAVSGPFARRGAPGLADRMRIDRFEPPAGDAPGVAVFTKQGPLLLGEARIEIAGAGPGRARVTWSERVHLAGPLPAAVTGRLMAPVLRGMLRFALARAVLEVAGATNRRRRA
ncbi:Immediate-early protein 2 [Cellulomonas sp. WB94]|nr:Immediate-early protein 2 [Cellulomonas sp. WB94]